MYYCCDGRVIGVLNYWDLATIASDSNTPGTGRTSTISFIALRLLTGRDIEHKFRHDAEPFIWAFVWVFGCSDGKKGVAAELYAMEEAENDQLCCRKNGFLGQQPT